MCAALPMGCRFTPTGSMTSSSRRAAGISVTSGRSGCFKWWIEKQPRQQCPRAHWYCPRDPTAVHASTLDKDAPTYGCESASGSECADVLNLMLEIDQTMEEDDGREVTRQAA